MKKSHLRINFIRLLPICSFVVLASPLVSAQASAPSQALSANLTLPDAPVQQDQNAAQQQTAQPPTIDQRIEAIAQTKLGPRFDPKAIDRSQAGLSLSAKDKIVLSFQEQTTVWAFTSEVLAAGWEHLLDGHPKYGTDSAAFGERLGAAAIRQSSQAVFSDGVFAATFHQDPRFYRLAQGSIGHRFFYAASQTWRTRMDSGAPAVNFSLLAGYGAAAALTKTYYPAVSSSWSRVGATFGWSLFGNMIGNQYHEFWPDIRVKVFHRQPTTPQP